MTTSSVVIRLWAVTSLILLLLALNVANAQQVVVGAPVVGGSGCPQGTVSATLSPDGTAISLIFDQFSVETPRLPRQASRMSCRFQIPVQVTPGYVLNALSVDYRGYMSIAHRSQATISTSNLFSNPRFGQPVSMVSTYNGTNPRLEQPFIIRHRSTQSRGNACRQQNTIDFTTELVITPIRGRGGIAATEDSFVSIDTADIADGEGPILIAFQVIPCR